MYFYGGETVFQNFKMHVYFFARPLYKNSNNANTFKYSKKAKRQLKSL